MKPASVKTFDYLYLGSIVIGVIGFALNYEALKNVANTELAASGVGEMGGGILIGSVVFGVLVNLALWFAVSVMRVEFIKWVIGLFAVWGLVQSFGNLQQGLALNLVLGLITSGMALIGLYFLFRPDAKAWFAEKRGDAG